MESVSIAVVEDREQYRKAMLRLLDLKPDLKCLGIFSSAEEALEAIPARIQPSIVLMDINLPGMTGVEAVRILRRTAPEIEIMMLTIYEDNDYVFQALSAGATGYVVKTSPLQEIYDAVIELHRGGSPMSDGIARKVVKFFHKKASVVTAVNIPEAVDYNLTVRESEILQYLVKGFRYKEIADMVFLAPDTVRKHIHNIYTKLEVHTRAEAINKLRP